MPRNPDTKRLSVYLSEGQYNALKEYAQYEYLGDDKADAKQKDMAAAIRAILSFAIPSFGEAVPLLGRGKYERRQK